MGPLAEAPYSTASNDSGDNRPLTDVAHEMFHEFGYDPLKGSQYLLNLPHASNECGGGGDGDSDDQGQTGEAWTPAAQVASAPYGNENGPFPDGIGQLDGIGLDTTSEATLGSLPDPRRRERL